MKYVDDTSIISFVSDINVSANQVNKDLEKISMWSYQWKMSVKVDISRQAQEIAFWKKNINVSHLPLYSNETNV